MAERKPGQTKEGFIRVCTEIEKEINDVFKEYEERTCKKINKSKLMYNVLKQESEKIKRELEEG